MSIGESKPNQVKEDRWIPSACSITYSCCSILAHVVDGKLVKLAKTMRSPIVTTDFNLNRVAEIQGVRVLNINELANAVKSVVLPGEEMVVRIIQEGKEMGQGVGYLEDGTMVVVEGGRRHLNAQLDIVVTRVLQTIAGRMIFAQPKTGVMERGA